MPPCPQPLATCAPSDDGLILCAPNGNIVAWNAQAERIFGSSTAEAVGRPVTRFFATQSRDEVQQVIGCASPDADAEWLVAEGVHESGAHMALSIAVSPLYAANGMMVGALVAVRKPSSAHSAAAETNPLVDSAQRTTPDSAPTVEDADLRNDWDAERINLALAAARLGDWSWDACTDMVTFSPRAAELFGIPSGRAMTRTAMREFMHPEDREAARIAVDRAIATRGDYGIEYRLINSGRERWISASGRARYDHRGEVLGMFGVVQDISKDRLLLRVDDAVRPLVKPEDITYTAARTLGQYLQVNRCAYAFVEDDQDTFSLTGNYTNGVQSIVGRYRFRQFGAECLRLMRAGEPYVVQDSESDARIDSADREAYRFTAIRAVICVPILKSGRFVAAMAVHTKAPRYWSAAEVELLQQVASRCWESIERARFEHEREGLLQAAEGANRMKDEFMAMLGHELRNPLAPILTALQMMKLRGDGESELERTVIERQVSHLTRLVDDLLDVSRIARGKVALKYAVVEISEVVARAIEVASPLLEQRSHTLEVRVPRTGLAVDGDIERLTQVLSNLLTNAGKYTPHGGRITISASTEDDQVVLRVLDTGVGMSEDILPHIFDVFVQGRQTIERAHGGLGLGLAIVRSLVERHGGSVSAHSAGLGRGSEFVMRLPKSKLDLASPARRTESSTLRSDTSGSGARILVVDDNEDAADMLALALRLAGCEVHVAHDGPHALRIGAAHRFDVALLDIGLPVMDGYELARHLRNLPNLRNTQLVAVTGYGQESDRSRALAAGFQEHLVKPVDLDALVTVVNRLPRDGER